MFPSRNATKLVTTAVHVLFWGHDNDAVDQASFKSASECVRWKLL